MRTSPQLTYALANNFLTKEYMLLLSQLVTLKTHNIKRQFSPWEKVWELEKSVLLQTSLQLTFVLANHFLIVYQNQRVCVIIISTQS
jgi:hypothetical protein